MSVSKFKTTSDKLQQAVAVCAALCPTKTPIMHHMLLRLVYEPGRGQLRVKGVGSYGDSVECTLAVTGCQGVGFGVMLPSQTLNGLMKTYGRDAVEMEISYDDADGGTAQIATGTGRFIFPNPFEAPCEDMRPLASREELDGLPWVEVPDLGEALDRTMFAAADNALRPQMNGVNVSFGEGKVLFTGASPAAISRFEPFHGAVSGAEAATLQMENVKYAASALGKAKSASPWRIHVGGAPKGFIIAREGVVYKAVAVAKAFPDCDRVFAKAAPGTEKGTMPITLAQMKSAVRRCAALSQGANFDVAMALKGERCEISQRSFDGTTGLRDEIAVEGASGKVDFALPSQTLSGVVGATAGAARLSLYDGGLALFTQELAKGEGVSRHQILTVLVNKRP